MSDGRTFNYNLFNNTISSSDYTASHTRSHLCGNLKSNTAVLYGEVANFNLEREAVLFRNVGKLLPAYMASHPSKQDSQIGVCFEVLSIYLPGGATNSALPIVPGSRPENTTSRTQCPADRDGRWRGTRPHGVAIGRRGLTAVLQRTIATDNSQEPLRSSPRSQQPATARYSESTASLQPTSLRPIAK
jgi:hypothetical protein